MAEFPLDALLDQDREDLFLIAMLFPSKREKNRENALPEDDEEDEEDDPRKAELMREMEEVQQELDMVSRRNLDSLSDRMGNMLFSVNEIDGGFSIEVEAAVSGDPDESLTLGIVNTGLTFLRMAVIADAPALAREILDASVSQSDGRVLAGADISHASLVGYLETVAEMNKKRRELSERLGEILQELHDIETSEEENRN